MGARNCRGSRPPEHPEVRRPLGKAPELRRSRSQSGGILGARCAERRFPSSCSKQAPVRLVVFDLDETLTLTTFMSRDGTYTSDQYAFTAKVNFESPWVEGSRIEMLKNMFEDIKRMRDGQERTLAILTRNENPGGISSVVNLLEVADLAKYFSAIWSMPWKKKLHNGAYRQGKTWTYFNPPVNCVEDHKANVLAHVGQNPQEWLPHRGMDGGPSLPDQLGIEEIVLVDDQRANFQSPVGPKVLRYCKVARYNAHYFDFGFMKNMGGIGAHDARDFALLTRFVQDPRDFKESLHCNCVQLEGAGRRAVSLVVFDFDETLTLATFMPEDAAFNEQVGWTPESSANCEWNQADLVTYNFESPWIQGSRVEKLKALFSSLTTCESGERRTLAVLTHNQTGAVAVLNLLLMAGLAEYFSAIWRLPSQSDKCEGVYFQAGQWHVFTPPAQNANGEHQVAADVLHHIAEHPSAWFPQLNSGDADVDPELINLVPQEIALVDDDRASFWSNRESGATVMRYCKVTRYDHVYRDCGFCHNMGGIGANSELDFEAIEHFIRAPWDFPYRGSRPQTILPPKSRADSEESPMDEELYKTMILKVPTMSRIRSSDEEVPTTREPRRRGTATPEAAQEAED